MFVRLVSSTARATAALPPFVSTLGALASGAVGGALSTYGAQAACAASEQPSETAALAGLRFELTRSCSEPAVSGGRTRCESLSQVLRGPVGPECVPQR